MKKLLLPLLLLSVFVGGCGPEVSETEKFQIVASLFPQYDFAREICGDRADVSLLLPPGTDSHSYAPTPADMVQIGSADLFLYTGDVMEPWAMRLSKGAGAAYADVSAGIRLLRSGDIHAHTAAASGEAAVDPHIWTNPQNAIIMVKNICEAICEKDPENADFYRENAARYTDELSALDREIETIVSEGKRREMVFGGHFAARYFTERYGLSHLSAFDSCSHEADPSPQTLVHIITEIKEKEIPAVFYEELSTPRTARLIAEETGASLLLFHSCHTVSKNESHETYLSLMRKNAENLRIGLN